MNRHELPTPSDLADPAVLHRDPTFIVIDKASGLLSVPGRGPTMQDCVISRLRLQFPDLPAQILAYFRSYRAADIAIFATPGWDFGDGKRGGHGGLRGAEDVLVPLLLAGPGIPPRRRVDVARTVDLMPSILALLGKPIPADLDGTPLVGIRMEREAASGASAADP